MKGNIPFLGAGIPEIRKYLLELNRKERLDTLPMNRQVGMVKHLLRGTYAEEKLAAIEEGIVPGGGPSHWRKTSVPAGPGPW